VLRRYHPRIPSCRPCPAESPTRTTRARLIQSITTPLERCIGSKQTADPGLGLITQSLDIGPEIRYCTVGLPVARICKQLDEDINPGKSLLAVAEVRALNASRASYERLNDDSGQYFGAGVVTS